VVSSLFLAQIEGSPSEFFPSRTEAIAASMHRLGIHLPLFVISDFAHLFCLPSARLTQDIVAAVPVGQQTALSRYRSLLLWLLQDAHRLRFATLPLSDDWVAILVSKLLGPVLQLLPSHSKLPVETLPSSETPLRVASLGQTERAAMFSWLADFCEHSTVVELRMALLDPEIVRFLHLAKANASAFVDEADRVDLLDLQALFEMPDVRDLVRFSLDLLPQILEAKHVSGIQNVPASGYAGLSHKGSLDSLLPSEMAQDEDFFSTRFALSELLYWGRERQTDAPPSLHMILIDSSPSMRGLRQVFARGLGLSLCQRLLREGLPVSVRFFDGRLHEEVRADRFPQRLWHLVLGFRGQRGRCARRVFSDLEREIATLTRDKKTRVTVHILTHAECHIPKELVLSLSRHAQLYAVFVRPSQDLALDYLPLLRGYHVVSDEVLDKESARKQQALSIVEKTTQQSANRSLDSQRIQAT